MTTTLKTLEQQGISFALNHDNTLTLTVDQSLTAYPETALTAELAELIKANKLEIIRQLRARANQYTRDRYAIARYQAEELREKRRAIDMRRQGLANCGNCLFFDSSPHCKQHGYCRNHFLENDNSVKKTDYCAKFHPLAKK